MDDGETGDEEKVDEVLVFHKGRTVIDFIRILKCVSIQDMLVRGLIQRAQKSSTQFGDCLALISFWKNSMAEYNDAKKVVEVRQHSVLFSFSNLISVEVQNCSFH